MRLASTFVGALAGVLVLAGYGLWMLVGAALGLDVHSDGRSEVLVPLLLGLLCIGVGIAIFLVRQRAGHAGWNGRISSGKGARERLLAMATFLPMLAVAGLARGDNSFWATRFAGAALALCSLGFVLLAHRLSDHTSRTTGLSGSLRALHDLLAAWFAGGLGLWWCITLQEPPMTHVANGTPLFGPWQLGLILIGLTLLLRLHPRAAQTDAGGAVSHAFSVGGALVVLACVLVALATITPWSAANALLAALSGTIGLALQRSCAMHVMRQDASAQIR